MNHDEPGESSGQTEAYGKAARLSVMDRNDPGEPPSQAEIEGMDWQRLTTPSPCTSSYPPNLPKLHGDIQAGTQRTPGQNGHANHGESVADLTPTTPPSSPPPQGPPYSPISRDEDAIRTEEQEVDRELEYMRDLLAKEQALYNARQAREREEEKARQAAQEKMRQRHELAAETHRLEALREKEERWKRHLALENQRREVRTKQVELARLRQQIKQHQRQQTARRPALIDIEDFHRALKPGLLRHQYVRPYAEDEEYL
jgi:hypothetical protein